jgi:hypothetical protein
VTRRNSDETLAEAREAILDFVVGAYENWRSLRAAGCSPKEPAVGVGLLAAYLVQHRVAYASPYLPDSRFFRQWVRRLTVAAVGRLVRERRLSSSFGVVDGREVRCYEPGPEGSS